MPFVAVGRAGTIGGCGPLRCGAAAVRPDESAAPASRGNGLRRTFRCGRDVPAAAGRSGDACGRLSGRGRRRTVQARSPGKCVGSRTSAVGSRASVSRASVSRTSCSVPGRGGAAPERAGGGAKSAGRPI
ncbi:MAG TPA: hypothetical protein DCW71_05470 [Alistipes sp.]|nr:hypothetical protein [Alistipes sp.]